MYFLTIISSLIFLEIRNESLKSIRIFFLLQLTLLKIRKENLSQLEIFFVPNYDKVITVKLNYII